MSELDRGAVETAPEAVYQNITTVADGLGEADLMRPSRCAGWADWDDRTYALKGTGREEVTADDRSALGALADRLPLFG
jgi:hypothetical protein